MSTLAQAFDTYRVGSHLLSVGDSVSALVNTLGQPLYKEPVESRFGGYIIEVLAGDSRVAKTALVARRGSYLTAVLPATLTARSLAGGDSPPPGVVPADRHCDPDELFVELRKLEVEIHQY